MNAWYFLSIPSYLFLAITAAARLADIPRTRWRPLDHARRLGLIGIGVTSLVVLFAPITWANDNWPNPDWQTALFGWSWMFAWLTTPSLPPWWDFILGVHRNTGLWKAQGIRARIRGEARALRDSFRLCRYREQPMNKRPRA